MESREQSVKRCMGFVNYYANAYPSPKDSDDEPEKVPAMAAPQDKDGIRTYMGITKRIDKQEVTDE